MTAISFTLDASTDLEHLTEIEQPELRTVRNLLSDMIWVKDFGAHSAEIGDDVEIDEEEFAITGTEIGIIYFPESGRAGITDNGGTHWTDASSVADAIRRYRENDMVG